MHASPSRRGPGRCSPASPHPRSPTRGPRRTRPRRAAGHRPPRRLGLPARAHARPLPARDRHGRRLHRARPRLDQGPRARRPPRERDHRHHRRRRSTRSSRRAARPRRSTAPPSRAGSPRTSRCAELKTLRAIERLPALRPANTGFDGLYEIPTLQEVIDLAKREGVGIYPETKHPTYFDSIGLSLEEPLVRTLRANGLDRRDADVFVQSFEVSNLQELDRELKVPLVQLTSATGRPTTSRPRATRAPTPTSRRRRACAASPATPTASGRTRTRSCRATRRTGCSRRRRWSRTPTAPGCWCTRTRSGRRTTSCPADFRQGNPASPEYLRARGNQPAELKLFFKLGVDGVFADNPDTAVAVRRKLFGR